MPSRRVGWLPRRPVSVPLLDFSYPKNTGRRGGYRRRVQQFPVPLCPVVEIAPTVQYKIRSAMSCWATGLPRPLAAVAPLIALKSLAGRLARTGSV